MSTKKHILCTIASTALVLGAITAGIAYNAHITHQEAESKSRFEKRLTAYKADFTERKNFPIPPAIDAAGVVRDRAIEQHLHRCLLQLATATTEADLDQIDTWEKLPILPDPITAEDHRLAEINLKNAIQTASHK